MVGVWGFGWVGGCLEVLGLVGFRIFIVLELGRVDIVFF